MWLDYLKTSLRIIISKERLTYPPSPEEDIIGTLSQTQQRNLYQMTQSCMDMKRYNLHNLIHVFIDPRVEDHILDRIEFQIGHFESDSMDDTNDAFRIEIRPYNEFVEGSDAHLHYHTRGEPETYWTDPDQKLAVERGENKFEIYTGLHGFNINIFIQFVLVESGFSLIHSAGYVDQTGGVTLLPGAGGAGKTSLLGDIMRGTESQLLGDDLVCLGADGRCLSFPRSFVFKEYHEEIYPDVFDRLNLNKKSKRDSITSEITRFVVENAPFRGIAEEALDRLGLFDTVSSTVLNAMDQSYLATVPINEIFGNDAIASDGTLERIIFLQRYEGSTFNHESISPELLYQQLFSIIHTEWKSDLETMFSLAGLGIISGSEYFDEVNYIIREGIKGAKIERLLIPQDAAPEELSEYFNNNVQ